MATLTTPAAGLAVASSREKACRIALRWIAGFVALGLAGHLIVLVWAQHEFTPVESLVALHSNMFAHGEGLYWGINRYPYTISAYGPIFYAISGYLHKLGLPAYQSGRLLAFAALITSLWLCWHGLGYVSRNRYARAAALILAGSTSNILFWGTTGQVDLLGCCFSLAGFAVFLKFRQHGSLRALALSGAFVILAVFTKQTFIAAGAAIALTLLKEDRKRAAVWIAGLVFAAGGIALGLNTLTHGGFFEDAIFANINPFAWFKFGQQAQYLLLTGAGVILTAGLGAWHASRQTAPVYLYAALAAGVWLVTAPKIGSDLNYQVEMMLAMTMCAGCALDQLDFFPSLFTARRTWVTLLQMPLLLHVALNVLLTVRVIAERAILEPFKARETAVLTPYVNRPGRILAAQYDSLVHIRGRIEVEPLIYRLLVKAGLTNPAPLQQDLETARFATVILADNVFAAKPAPPDLEHGTLTEAQLDAVRRKYTLVRQVDGPNSVFVYEPRTN